MSEAEMVIAGLEFKEGRWGFAATKASNEYFERLRQASMQRNEEVEA
jgi:hypothetical protein